MRIAGGTESFMACLVDRFISLHVHREYRVDDVLCNLSHWDQILSS